MTDEKYYFTGKKFILHVEFPTDYPYKPPKVTFKDPFSIWHPNVDPNTGKICLDILEKEWTPALTIKQVLLSIMVLLMEPNLEDTLNA
jgi:ubiquitin-protein ligase